MTAVSELSENDLSRAADALRAARSGERLAELPADVIPGDPESAYRIQELVIGRDRIGGWKMAARPSPSGRRCSAISREWLLPDGATLPSDEFRAPEIEVEIAFRLKDHLPPRADAYRPSEVEAALGPAIVVFELVDSRFIDRRKVSSFSLLADSYSCGAVCVGSGTRDWKTLDFAALEVQLAEGAEEIARTTGGVGLGDMLDGLTWLANHTSRRGLGLRAGQLVLTGARIGPLPIAIGESRQLTGTVEGLGTVQLAIARPADDATANAGYRT